MCVYACACVRTGHRKKHLECLPVTARGRGDPKGEPPWRARPALGGAVRPPVSRGITGCQGRKPAFSQGLLKTQPLSLGRVSTVGYSPWGGKDQTQLSK